MVDKILSNEDKYRNQQLNEWNNLFGNLGQKKPKIDNWLDKFLHILKHSEAVPIIDLGCGFGNDTLYLTEKGFRVISCDYSEEALKRLILFQIPSQDYSICWMVYLSQMLLQRLS